MLADRPVETLRRAAHAGLNSPLCSSAGRLFDAVTAAAGLCVDHQDYEGEAAMRLQAAAERWIARNGAPDGYPFEMGLTGDGLTVVDPDVLWPAIAGDLDRGDATGALAARFHVGYAKVWAEAVRRAAGSLEQTPIIVMSGGVFQNRLLASMLASELDSSGFAVLQHRDIPANDGGLALGQIAIALARQSASDR